MIRMLALFVVSLAALAQPPAIGQNGVVNASSHIAPSLAGGALARGGRISIDGVRLGISADRTRVVLRQGLASFRANVVQAAPKHVEAVLPEAIPAGRYNLTLSVDGVESLPFSVSVVEENPGLFSRNGEGWGPGRFDVVAAAGRSEVSFARPVRPGQRVAAAVSGVGRRTSIPVTVGNRVTAASVRKLPSRAGEQEIEFTVPAGVPPGCFVPVFLEAAPGRASNVVTLPVSSGKACDLGPVGVFAGASIGISTVSRTRVRFRESREDRVYDEVFATFLRKDAGPVVSPFLLLPPPGTCTAYTSSYQAATVLPNSVSDFLVTGLPGRPLDAGPELTLVRDTGARALPEVPGAAGLYRTRLGSSEPHSRPLFLSPGPVRLSAPGGSALQSFNVTLESPPPFDWVNRDRLSTIDRRRGAAIEFRDTKQDRLVIVLAMNVDTNSTASGACLCVARASAGRVNIPPALLANLPASEPDPAIPYDRLFVVALPAKPAVPIRIPSIDSAAVVPLFIFANIVTIR